MFERLGRSGFCFCAIAFNGGCGLCRLYCINECVYVCALTVRSHMEGHMAAKTRVRHHQLGWDGMPSHIPLTAVIRRQARIVMIQIPGICGMGGLV